METKPLLNYRKPNYPQIEVVLTEPDILLKNMPQTWQANKLIITAMISFSLSACKGDATDVGKAVKTELSAFADKINDVVANKTDTTQIAPIFVHGEGVGASGCVMVAPPVYLSETDAMKIIQHELKKQGFNFDDPFHGDSLSVECKEVVFNQEKGITNYKDRISYKTQIKHLYPDAYNKDLNFVIQFVSYDDYEKLSDEEPEWSSVSTFKIKQAAEKIRKAYLDEGKHNTVVFYDPVGWPKRESEDDWDEMKKTGRENAIKMLELQVTDFIKWLKKEYKPGNK
jgi:hypothetical protein